MPSGSVIRMGSERSAGSVIGASPFSLSGAHTTRSRLELDDVRLIDQNATLIEPRNVRGAPITLKL